MDFQYEYVKDHWDDYLNSRSNGERVRYQVIDYCFPYEGTVTDGVIEAFKKLQVLSSESVESCGRTFYSFNYKIYDGVIDTSRDKEYYFLDERYYDPRSSRNKKAKIAKLSIKLCCFKDENETAFAEHFTNAMKMFVAHIEDILGVDRNYGIKKVLTKVRDEDSYKKAHPLKDRYGVVFEIGDMFATDSYLGPTILTCTKMNMTQVNRCDPNRCVIVYTKNPNKKLGWI